MCGCFFLPVIFDFDAISQKKKYETKIIKEINWEANGKKTTRLWSNLKIIKNNFLCKLKWFDCNENIVNLKNW
jgi:hypothetical protein